MWQLQWLLLHFILLLSNITHSFRHTSCCSKVSNRIKVCSHLDRKDDQQQILSIKQSTRSKLYEKLIFGAALFGPIMVFPSKSNAQGFYLDKKHKYAIEIPPSWTVLEKTTPTAAMAKFQSEQVLMTATTFVEASSLSVTKTNAARLLKDFDIDWWFSPLNSITDVGSAELIAELLILQRQGEFEKKVTTSKLYSASIIKSPEEGNSFLRFEFNTPLAEGITRDTIAKAFFRGGSLVVVWISALSSVMNGDYRPQLDGIRDSFHLTE